MRSASARYPAACSAIANLPSAWLLTPLKAASRMTCACYSLTRRHRADCLSPLLLTTLRSCSAPFSELVFQGPLLDASPTRPMRMVAGRLSFCDDELR